ncbi:MAG: hypothetical protein PHP52_06190 [Bacteroidales bacterium]|nr:hypothetical protein [Bacteroidales bacterium]MDD4217038.1 hypothetical protein [Bacteroidales bacterium]MDY0143275.1 hypothetical protein [Bacteroidales bacterium]
MKKLMKINGIILCLMLIFNNVFAQDNNANIVKDRYIIINNIDEFFSFTNDESSELVSFELFNIYENESSKPLFVSVNELPNVIKFNIKSNSEQFENQRTCYLRIKKTNYLITFQQVLQRMEVAYIKIDNNFIELEKYFVQPN